MTTLEEARDAVPRVTETWTCAGARVHNGKLWTLWVWPDGAERYYATRGFVTGGIYTLSVSRYEHGGKPHSTYWGEPEYAGRLDAGDERLVRWRAEEIAAEVRDAAAKRERSAKRQDPLDAALQPLIDIAAKMPMAADRRALAAYVLLRIENAAW